MSLRDLAPRLTGEVVLPGDATWDVDRQVWNLAVDQRPSGIVWPRTAEDVVETVRFAAERGLRIAFNAGGHNAGTIAWADDIAAAEDRADGGHPHRSGGAARPRRGRGAGQAPRAGRRRARPRVPRRDLARRRRRSGTRSAAASAGSIRRHGLACNTITAADIVTADGRLVHVDADSEPDLFWAIRGGGGNVGAVTSIELELFAIPQVYAGLPVLADRAGDAGPRAPGATGSSGVPLECESLGRMLQLPDVPFLPDHLRGRSFVLVELAFIGTRGRGSRARAAAPGPRAGVRHGRDDADERAERREHGSRDAGAVCRRGPPARRRVVGDDRRAGRGLRRLAAPPRRGAAARWRGRGELARSRAARRDRAALRALHVRARPRPGLARGCRTTMCGGFSSASSRGTAGGAT